MKKRICLLLSFVLCLAMLTQTALALGDAPAVSDNVGDHDYINYWRWTDPSRSALIANDDGTFTRVEHVDSGIVIETYAADFTYLSGRLIEMELPIYGGFHNGEDYHFLIFGQENPDERDDVEVIRVVRYTKDWQRVDAASLYGANTTVPFDAGGMSTDEYNGYLYLRTSHEMYTFDDGLNHQANLTLNIRIPDMTITDSVCEILNLRYGYVSHSFNQFIRVDKDTGDLVAVDHGDAHPRSVVLFRYYAPAGQDSLLVPRDDRTGYVESVDLLPICGSYGANDTGVSVGGFEISGAAYLTAGNTLPQKADDNLDGARNIFLAVTDKDTLATEIKYFTSYPNSPSIEVSNPQLTKIHDDRFLLSWSVVSGGGCQYYVFVDGEGNSLTDVFALNTLAYDTIFSDCQPIVANGKVCWYATANSEPIFRTIDVETGAYAESVLLRNPFTDVAESQYYYDPVLWAVGQGITTGTSETTFGPDKPCTRAQVVTFLWRAAGSPEPASSYNPFLDVSAGQYYYKAVLWAVEQGITTGTSATTFGPDRPCTRAQVVTFLWRSQHSPHTTGANTFTDVAEGQYYYSPVLWAVANGITTGTSATAFAPDKTCTRAQIVTFLYRAMA